MFLLLAIVVAINGGRADGILHGSRRNVEEKFNEINASECAILIAPRTELDREVEKTLKQLKCDFTKFNNAAGIDDSALRAISDAATRLSNDGSILLVTDEDASGSQLFLTTLEDAVGKRIKVFVMWQSYYEGPILNLEKMAFATEGYFFHTYDDRRRIIYEEVLKRKSVLGRYTETFRVGNSTKRIFIRISGDFECIAALEIVTPSGEKLNSLGQKDALFSRKVYFAALAVRQSGVWTVRLDAKKRLFINIINEHLYELEDHARFSRLVAAPEDSPPAVSVAVGSGSELIATPNKRVNVYFEVTNNREQPITVKFRCTDTKSILLSMQSNGETIAPDQTISVAVTAQTTISPGDFDVITFTVKDIPNAQKVAHLFVVNNDEPLDTEGPHLWYTLTDDCTDVSASECHTGNWSADIWAQDEETGLMRLYTRPRGIYFGSGGFVSGSKEEVTGRYSATCCNSTVEVTAVDLSGNERNLTIDAQPETTLSAGVISAISLGVIFLVIIIIVVVYFVVRRKQKDSLDLPTYRGPSGGNGSF